MFILVICVLSSIAAFLGLRLWGSDIFAFLTGEHLGRKEEKPKPTSGGVFFVPEEPHRCKPPSPSYSKPMIFGTMWQCATCGTMSVLVSTLHDGYFLHSVWSWQELDNVDADIAALQEQSWWGMKTYG